MPVQQLSAVDTNSGDFDRITAERVRLLAAKLKLYQSTFNPTASSVIADFVAAEATYTGYAGVVLVWNPVSINQGGGWAAISNNAFFQATDAVSPNVIGGAWVETGAGALVEYFPFPLPVPMAQALDAINAIVSLLWPEPDFMIVNY